MTGQEILKTAADLLGYNDANGNFLLSARISSTAVTTVNRIYSDLWHICNDTEFTPIKTLQEEIKLPERVLNDVMPYGVAMMMAQSESDGDQQQMYSVLYNRKRASLSKTEKIQDVLPRCCL